MTGRCCLGSRSFARKAYGNITGMPRGQMLACFDKSGVLGTSPRLFERLKRLAQHAGTVLAIEVSPESMTWRVVNSSQSASMTLILHSAFFDHFVLYQKDPLQTSVLLKVRVCTTQHVCSFVCTMFSNTSRPAHHHGVTMAYTPAVTTIHVVRGAFDQHDVCSMSWQHSAPRRSRMQNLRCTMMTPSPSVWMATQVCCSASLARQTDLCIYQHTSLVWGQQNLVCLHRTCMQMRQHMQACTRNTLWIPLTLTIWWPMLTVTASPALSQQTRTSFTGF